VAFKTRLYLGLPSRPSFFTELAGGIQGLGTLVAQVRALVPDTLGGIAVVPEKGFEVDLAVVLDGLGLLGWVKNALRDVL